MFPQHGQLASGSPKPITFVSLHCIKCNHCAVCKSATVNCLCRQNTQLVYSTEVLDQYPGTFQFKLAGPYANRHVQTVVYTSQVQFPSDNYLPMSEINAQLIWIRETGLFSCHDFRAQVPSTGFLANFMWHTPCTLYMCCSGKGCCQSPKFMALPGLSPMGMQHRHYLHNLQKTQSNASKCTNKQSKGQGFIEEVMSILAWGCYRRGSYAWSLNELSDTSSDHTQPQTWR